MNNELPINREEPGCGTMSRRQLAKNLLAGITAGVFLPGLSLLHPIHEHFHNGPLLDSFDEILAAGNYRPAYLSGSQLASVDRIADAIVPGSHKARSAEFIDLLLSVDSAKSQQAFVNSLSAFEASAEQIFQKNIVALTSARLDEILQSATAKNSSNRDHFENLKGWVVGAYYSSEIGMRELGWTPDRVFPSYPVCAHPESHS